jgi:predicted MFS family arabinose efflux permease
MTTVSEDPRRRLSGDARRVVLAQALRAGVYGFGSVLLGATLDSLGFSAGETGLVLGAVVAGTVVASLAVGRWSDRWGRRRSYVTLYVLLACTGVVFAIASSPWVLAVVALTGALSTEVVESGPFTSLEQAMLATDLAGRERLRGFSLYNAVAAACGSLGALAAVVPGRAREIWTDAPTDQRWFLVFVPAALAGAIVAGSLSPRVEADRRHAAPRRQLRASRPAIVRLAGLFAVDSFGGGFTVQSFIAFWLHRRFGASTAEIGVVFAAMGMLQTGSFLAAGRLAERFGLLRTMVFTHLPSNLLLGAVAFAPGFGVAVALLLARTALSQMDVPTRQVYVMTLVDPNERTAATATTNTARYAVRPLAPPLAGAAASSIALGAPFVIAGAIKAAYDLVLWRWFATVPVPDDSEVPA